MGEIEEEQVVETKHVLLSVSYWCSRGVIKEGIS